MTISPTTTDSTALPVPTGGTDTPGDPGGYGFAALLAMLVGGQTPTLPTIPVAPSPAIPATPATLTTPTPETAAVPTVPTALVIPGPPDGIVHDVFGLSEAETGRNRRGLSEPAGQVATPIPLPTGTPAVPAATPARPAEIPSPTSPSGIVHDEIGVSEPVIARNRRGLSEPAGQTPRAQVATDALTPAPAPSTQESYPTGAPAPVQPPAANTAPRGLTPVTTQVIPEVTRLVSQGDGTHRLTLKLQPAALGDVRVVLTVRGGEVRVSLAAGTDARAALLADAPALHRMLSGTGAETTRIVVRDLLGTQPGTLAAATSDQTPANTSQVAAPANSNGVGADGTGAFGPGHHSSPGHEGPGEGQARTPGHTPATDGRSRDGGHPVTGRTIDQDTVTPSSGVDVTM